jgi:dolichol-phosphate mannosyltransferase
VLVVCRQPDLGWLGCLISAMFFLGGIQIILLGVPGSYIGRTYDQVQNRP